MSAVRIEIDKGRCVGAGMCALTAPDVFTQDDDGLSEILPGRAETAAGQAAVKEAVRACPVGAVSLADGEE
ncbi:ferredoxin [Streptomyces beihaiensis]|uniref:Ferredoxin n=1 Tax=Streptomyces beihaiensis TaxID=2984495 RepID=A0ABT3U4C2_9ACTN|nr:ferredoxin [Streptomyces beihaiensis]MCX3063085.1 ferredoxin [Streptomyces beihaiensis]